eukprot:14372436-Alexandrium_andersonii.AAC.1
MPSISLSRAAADSSRWLTIRPSVPRLGWAYRRYPSNMLGLRSPTCLNLAAKSFTSVELLKGKHPPGAHGWVP